MCELAGMVWRSSLKSVLRKAFPFLSEDHVSRLVDFSVRFKKQQDELGFCENHQ